MNLIVDVKRLKFNQDEVKKNNFESHKRDKYNKTKIKPHKEIRK